MTMETAINVPANGKSRPPVLLVGVLLLLVAVFLAGLKWILTLGTAEVGSAPFLLFDYAVGLSMIFLPCTLPLAFVIVPLVMGQSYQKGIGMALAFGAGVTITLSIYGILIGFLGQALGVAQVETAKNILYALAGLLAAIFGLGELGLLPFRAPTYNGSIPDFIMRRRDVFKAGLMGLFLGNVGVGCPNPLFNAVIIPQIVATGSPLQGWIIMVVQALGRVTPLLILAFLAILGINATKFLVEHKDNVNRITAWMAVFVGGFLLTLGLFGHDWWVISGIHTVFELVTQEGFITSLLGSKIGGLGHGHAMSTGTGLFGLPIVWGTPFILAVWILPMWWYLWTRRRAVLALPPDQQAAEKKYYHLQGTFLVTLVFFLYLLFGYLLPHQFSAHWAREAMMHDDNVGVERKVRAVGSESYILELSSRPRLPLPGEPFRLNVSLSDDNGSRVRDYINSHERIMHLILISDDLKEFHHVHPEDFEEIWTPTAPASGTFGFSLTLETAGRYRVLVDAARKGAGEIAASSWLTIGEPDETIVLEKDLRRGRIFGNTSVELRPDLGELTSGQPVKLSYIVTDTRTNQSVKDLKPYLGADMHLAVASVDLAYVSHWHGTKSALPGSATIEVPGRFPFPGLFKLYGQFMRGEKLVTTEFMVEVAPGEEMMEEVPHGDDH